MQDTTMSFEQSKDHLYRITISDDMEAPYVDTNDNATILTVTILLENPHGTPLANQMIRIYPYDVSNTLTLTSNGAPATGSNPLYTDANGEIILMASVLVPTTVSIRAGYTILDEGDEAIETATQLKFTGAEVEKISIVLDRDSAEMTTPIKVTATALTTRDKPVAGFTIRLTIEQAYGGRFINGDTGVEIVRATDANGIITAEFTAGVWCQGLITAVAVDTGSEDIDSASANFVFTVDALVKVKLDDLAILPFGSGYEDGAGSVAPADGVTRFIVAGAVTHGDAELTDTATFKMTIQDPSNGAEFLGSNHPHTIVVQSGHAIPDTSLSTRTVAANRFEACLIGKLPTTGTIYVTLDDEAATPVGDPINFTFVNPWAVEQNLAIKFPDSSSTYRIYANNIHQAEVIVRFKLLGWRSTPLPTGCLPTVEEALACVAITDFSTGLPLEYTDDPTETPSAPWAYGTERNGALLTNLGQSSAVTAAFDVDRSVVDADGATLFYYIRSRMISPPDAITLGFTISPNGSKLVKGMSAEHPVTWTIAKADVSPHYAGKNFVPDGPFVIKTLPPPNFTVDSLTCTGVAVRSAFQNDSGRQLTDSTGDYAMNFYRQINYTIAFSSSFLATYQLGDIAFSTTSSADIGPNYCYSSRTVGLYSFNLYVWPEDLHDLDTKGRDKPQNGAYLIKGGLNYGATAVVNSNQMVITVTRYIALSAPNAPSVVKQSDVNIVATDSYGNQFKFYLQADRVPPAYDIAALQSATIFTIGTGAPAATESTYTGGYGYKNLVTSKWLGGHDLPPLTSNMVTPSQTATEDYKTMIYMRANVSDTRIALQSDSIVAIPQIVLSDTVIRPTYSFIFPVEGEDSCVYQLIYDTNYDTSTGVLASKLAISPDTLGLAGNTIAVGAALYPVWEKLGVLIALHKPGPVPPGDLGGYAGSGTSELTVTVDAAMGGSNRGYIWAASP